jgi:SAM-dependent methyltransferase
MMDGYSLTGSAKRFVANATGRPYGDEFFAAQEKDSLASARSVVPIVTGLLQPGSVLDVGCGVGTWLSAFREAGIEDVLGIDGDYVPRDRLKVPLDAFQPVDISKRFDLGRKFDLAISLEVGEHLPQSSAGDFVGSLAAHADAVLFSAAIPNQRGSQHVNEQWQSWWADRFAAQGMVAVDCVRRKVWDDPNVAWWYAQNTLLYVRPPVLAANDRLRLEHEILGTGQLSLVHPARYVKWRKRWRDMLA